MKNTYLKRAVSIAALLLVASQATPLQAATAATKGYRYWGYYQAAPGATMWKTAMTGPTVELQDGAVEGWDFVFSSEDVPSGAPSVKPNFASICAKVKKDPDVIRVGLVIDFGISVISPKGEKPGKTITTCITTAKHSVGLDVLANAVKVRTAPSGLICAFNGYPAKECGAEITTPAALLKK
jgi:hypothetical protein